MSKLEFTPETPLYTSDARGWRINQLADVLQHIFASGKPLVLFVHGRGKEPQKSLRGGTFTKGLAVHKIEAGYDAKVLMFNWDSAFEGFKLFDRERPLSHTKAAGAALGKVLSGLHLFRSAHPGTPLPALLAHSMGSVVVQRAVEDGDWPDVKGLFSAAVFSEPDADDVGHESWLSTVAQRENTFVTFNQDDHVLRRSNDARPVDAHALGLGTLEPLATRAKYIDLTKMGSLGKKDQDHEVFGKGAMNGQLYVCNFFTQVLTGQLVVLDKTTNVESIEREVIYRLRSRAEPNAPCLRIPDLPNFS